MASFLSAETLAARDRGGQTAEDVALAVAGDARLALALAEAETARMATELRALGADPSGWDESRGVASCGVASSRAVASSCAVASSRAVASSCAVGASTSTTAQPGP
jgi:hypothetical protein